MITCHVDVDRPVSATDADDPAMLERLHTALEANVSAPAGDSVVAGGQQEIVDAVLYTPLTEPELATGDLVTYRLTGDAYRVTWARRRHGLGLDHQQAGLRAVRGSALG